MVFGRSLSSKMSQTQVNILIFLGQKIHFQQLDYGLLVSSVTNLSQFIFHCCWTCFWVLHVASEKFACRLSTVIITNCGCHHQELLLSSLGIVTVIIRYCNSLAVSCHAKMEAWSGFITAVTIADPPFSSQISRCPLWRRRKVWV